MLVKGNNLHTNDIKNILLIQLGDIGDVVYSFPCVKALKETYPAAKVVIAVRDKTRELLEDCPWVDGVIAVDTQKRNLWQQLIFQKFFWGMVRSFGFDLAIDLRNGTRGAILAFLSGAAQRIGRYAFDGKLWRNRLFTHLVLPDGGADQFIAEYYLDTIAEYGITTENLNPEIRPAATKAKAIFKLLRNENVPTDKPIVAIQPFSLWAYKEWAASKFVQLIQQLTKEFDIAIIITGAPSEREKAEAIVSQCGDNVFNLAGKTSLNLLASLLKECKLFLGVDSAGVHIAAAVGTPTVSLYGPSPSEVWAPKGENHSVIRKDFDCVPCRETGCQGSMVSRCMDELTVDEVLPIIKKKLKVP